MTLRSFLASRSGNFSMMLAATMPLILVGVGLAVDVATMLNAKTKLQAALDAAVLASSHLKDPGLTRQQVFDNFLAANLAGHSEFSNVEGALVVEPGVNRIESRGNVTADVRLNLMHRLGASTRIAVTSAAAEATSTLEVAMVLDNTGSMGSARMAVLRDAATALATILEDAAEKRDVKAALVPFVTAVNVKGEGYDPAWIDMDGEAPHHGAHFEPDGLNPYNHLDLFSALGVTWKGCVEARPAPHNLDDTPPDPTRPETLFVPYFAPDNPGAAARSPNSGSDWNNSYLDDSNRLDPVVNSDPAPQRTVARYFDAATPRYIDEAGPRSTGPNYACATPIMPLTDDFAKLKTAIGEMIHWEGSGTNVSEGLAWGMRVLSPAEPYTQALPFDDSVSKAVVVFTDGENTVFGAGNSSLPASDSRRLPFNMSDYGAYGFLDSNRMGTLSRGAALSNVNAWTLTMCERLKDRNVRVFTVLLGADTAANRALYSECASTPADYYPTSDVSQLEDVFKNIGAAVTQLYLTQ